jgi:hypothetical protein
LIESMPTHAALLRSNMRLPVEVRQSAVLIEFAQPVMRPLMSDFLLIHLAPMQLVGGETASYMPHIVQPHLVEPQRCSICYRQMERLALTQWRCQNTACRTEQGRPTNTIVQHTPATRGVVRLIHAAEWLHHTATIRVPDTLVDVSIEYATAVALQLDRRYPMHTLAAVGRAARQVAEQRGWALRG